jgi:hypothetical protein
MERLTLKEQLLLEETRNEKLRADIASLQAENKRLTERIGFLEAVSDMNSATTADAVKQYGDVVAELTDIKGQIERGEMVKLEPGDGYWYCFHCHDEVSCGNVTYQEKHNRCGHPVEWIEPMVRAALKP